MTTTPAGWYDDGQGSLRWWDGTQWTDHVQGQDAAATPIATDAAAVQKPPIDLTADMPPETAPAAPEAYPGGYAAQASASPVPQLTYAGPVPVDPHTAPQAKRSPWWIWVVAGAAFLIALVVIAVILIPVIMRAVGGNNEQAAAAAVKTYDRAWQTVDCDLMFSTTTEGFREDFDLTECGVFEDQATQFAADVSDYTVKVTSTETQEDGTVVVETTETYVSRFDEDGNDTGSEQNYTDLYTYLVVPQDSSWLIDDYGVE